MKFLSAIELAQKWGVDRSFVLRLARAGRIEGAKRFGSKWMFSSDTQRPADGRTKSAKEKKKTEEFFRFPLYVNFKETSYYPPLSSEEKLLRKAQIAFQACYFEEAKELLEALYKSAESRYIRMSAIYHMLYIAVLDNSPEFDALLFDLNTALTKDLPYKKEMMLLRYGFNADNAYYKSILDEFEISADYSYHPSAYNTLILVSFLPIENGDYSLLSRLRYDTYELLCQQMERDGCYLEAQKLHYLLLIAYQLQQNTDKINYHIRRGLEIAQEYNLIFAAANYERFYPTPTHEILKDFPSKFAQKIISLGSFIQQRQNEFVNSQDNPSFLGKLSSNEFEYAFLANQGYTNREIAHKKKISEKTVSKIYNEIYDKLGVKDKQELIGLINNTHSNRTL